MACINRFSILFVHRRDPQIPITAFFVSALARLHSAVLRSSVECTMGLFACNLVLHNVQQPVNRVSAVVAPPYRRRSEY